MDRRRELLHGQAEQSIELRRARPAAPSRAATDRAWPGSAAGDRELGGVRRTDLGVGARLDTSTRAAPDRRRA